MSSPRLPSWQDRLAPQRQALLARWQALSPRERLMLTVAAAAVGLLLLWWVALQPVWQTWRTVPPKARALEAQWLQMQAQAQEARDLRGQPAVGAQQAAEALQAASARLGAKASLQVLADRATLTLKDLSPEELRQWLGEARQAARARPVEAQITRQASGLLRGQVVLQLPGGPA
ncbi:type II secretion system protein GspM [Ideonella livida]|uniref:Type II secretion system protein M n=1 Tax=Ideonella livida TaxID=2707176 RepID=A0A7C9TKV6_9BURK|nr:type II secretion system protein GspM [Ideonella livida]NDY92778.1 type II secretion system protein M [Ideonella livida]